MKIRNWLIKKLGGYTRSEYALTGAWQPVKFDVSHVNVEKIEARTVLRRERIPINDPGFDDYVKHDIAHKIADKLVDDGYIEFMTCDGHVPFDSVEVLGRLKVVNPEFH